MKINTNTKKLSQYKLKKVYFKKLNKFDGKRKLVIIHKKKLTKVSNYRYNNIISKDIYVCKDFKLYGTCSYGTSCKFAHIRKVSN